jgi:pimeloyl-ACP methyl ester carboxylesterase
MQSFPWSKLGYMPERLCTFEGRNINFSQNSSDSPNGILFLHGVTRNWRTFYPLFSELNNECQLTAIDFRGHGKSERTPGSYLVTDYIKDASAVLKESRSSRQFIYGHSLGAMVALAAAARTGKQVAGIILEDPPFSTMGARINGSQLHRFFIGLSECLGQKSSAELLFQKISNIPLNRKEEKTLLIKDLRDEMSRWYSAESIMQIDSEVLDPIVKGQWLDGYELQKLARKVSCPVLLLQADQSVGGMLTDADVNLLKKSVVSELRCIQFSGVDHSIHINKPNDIIQLIRKEISGN